MLINKRYITVQFSEVELRARNRALAVLLDLSNFLSHSQRLTEVLDGALQKVLEHFDLDAGRIYLMEEDGQSLSLAAHRGLEVTGLERVHISEGFTGKSARTRSFILQDASALEDQARAALLARKGLQIIICIPLIAMGKVVGVLNLAASKAVELDQGGIDLFALIGNQIAIAIQNARLYETLETKFKEVAEKNETIKFFAYSALHDLKSPLIGIHGLSRLLNQQYRELLDDKGKSYCDQILKAAAHAQALVERINIYVTAKEAPLKIEPLPVREITQTIRNEFAAALQRRGVKWSEPQELPVVKADRLSLIRILRNLVDNALKYGGEELREISIGYRDEGLYHIFSVSDDGVGIRKEDQDRIFKAFQRQETSRGVEGSGLGLAITRVIAERHGGSVRVENGVPKGVTFSFSIAKEL